LKKKVQEMERLVYQGTNVSNVLMGCLGTAREVLLGNGTCDDFMGNGTCGDFMGNKTCDDLGEWNIVGYEHIGEMFGLEKTGQILLTRFAYRRFVPFVAYRYRSVCCLPVPFCLLGTYVFLTFPLLYHASQYHLR
jgi:hypothetical protein